MERNTREALVRLEVINNKLSELVKAIKAENEEFWDNLRRRNFNLYLATIAGTDFDSFGTVGIRPTEEEIANKFLTMEEVLSGL